MEHINEVQIGNYILRTYYDESPSDPREDSNLTKMVCFPKHLGDDHDINFHDYDSWDEMEKKITGDEDPLIIKPLYIYEHGAITIRTSSFNDRWDSRQLGFVYVRKQDVRDDFFIKRCGQAIKERVDVLLEGEVDTYDKYLQGRVYGYRVFKVTDGIEEELDSCWGFYDEDDCMNDARGIAEYYISNEQVLV